MVRMDCRGRPPQRFGRSRSRTCSRRIRGVELSLQVRSTVRRIKALCPCLARSSPSTNPDLATPEAFLARTTQDANPGQVSRAPNLALWKREASVGPASRPTLLAPRTRESSPRLALRAASNLAPWMQEASPGLALPAANFALTTRDASSNPVLRATTRGPSTGDPTPGPGPATRHTIFAPTTRRTNLCLAS